MTGASNIQHAKTLVEHYITNRDRLTALKKAYDQEKDAIEAVQTRIEQALDKLLQESGLENLKTEFGTAFPVPKTTVNIANWDETLKFILENQAYHLLNKAVSKTAVEEYMRENGDIPPPGVNYQVFRTIQVRRPAKATRSESSNQSTDATE